MKQSLPHAGGPSFRRELRRIGFELSFVHCCCRARRIARSFETGNIDASFDPSQRGVLLDQDEAEDEIDEDWFGMMSTSWKWMVKVTYRGTVRRQTVRESLGERTALRVEIIWISRSSIRENERDSSTGGPSKDPIENPIIT